MPSLGEGMATMDDAESRGERHESVAQRAREADLPMLGTIPEDPFVLGRSQGGSPLLAMEQESAASRAVAGVLERLLAGAGAPATAVGAAAGAATHETTSTGGAR